MNEILWIALSVEEAIITIEVACRHDTLNYSSACFLVLIPRNFVVTTMAPVNVVSPLDLPVHAFPD